MNWFTNWFDSPYYHILYKNRDEKEAELFIDKLIEKLQLKKGCKLIDIACGKGRHATYFNKKGMDVVGVDLSKNSLSAAKQFENSSLMFEMYDMREVYKENYFDIATNLFTSFGYFDNENDNLNAMNAIAKNLKSEGLLIIDFLNVKKAITNLLSSEQKTIDGIVFNINRKVEEEHIIKDIAITDGTIKQKYQEKVKAMTLANFTELISKSGLKIIDIFGNYKLEDFNVLTSDRLILICKK